MHTVVIKWSVLDANPWVAVNMMHAFRQSKDLALKRMQDPRAISLAWVRELIEEQARILGPDPWSYEFDANRTAIQTMIRYSHDQGMIDTPFPSEELFVPASLDELPEYV